MREAMKREDFEAALEKRAELLTRDWEGDRFAMLEALTQWEIDSLQPVIEHMPTAADDARAEALGVAGDLIGALADGSLAVWGGDRSVPGYQHVYREIEIL